jgi:hypothetical protein
MLTSAELADLAELNQLAFRYAAAVDTGDVDGFVALFHPEARMRVFAAGADEPFTVQVGHDELAAIPTAMRERFIRTAHFMTNHLVDLDGDAASGSVLCAARHLPVDAPGTELVIVLRYLDQYERRSGHWRFHDRELRFQWTNTHPVLPEDGPLLP